MNLTLWKIEYNETGIAYVISEDTLMKAVHKFVDDYDKKNEAAKKRRGMQNIVSNIYDAPKIKSIEKLSESCEEITGGVLFTEVARAELRKNE